MILVDYSQAIVANAFALRSEIVGTSQEDVTSILRNGTLSMLKSYKRRFSPTYGDEIVVLCDGNNYWRKDLYPSYKGNRKKIRDESDLPWDLIGSAKEQLVGELIEVSPYRFIRVNRAEADDIFAVICRRIAAERFDPRSLFDPVSESVLMVASDEDLKQLHSPTVRQWSPMTDKMVTLEPKETPMDFLKKKILTGDRGDWIPNVFNDLSCLDDGIRQKPATEKKMLPLLECEYSKMEEGTEDVPTKKRIELNRKLISFDEIPKEIIDEIIAEYNKPNKGNREKLYRYLSKHRCAMLLAEIAKF